MGKEEKNCLQHGFGCKSQRDKKNLAIDNRKRYRKDSLWTIILLNTLYNTA